MFMPCAKKVLLRQILLQHLVEWEGEVSMCSLNEVSLVLICKTILTAVSGSMIFWSQPFIHWSMMFALVELSFEHALGELSDFMVKHAQILIVLSNWVHEIIVIDL